MGNEAEPALVEVEVDALIVELTEAVATLRVDTLAEVLSVEPVGDNTENINGESELWKSFNCVQALAQAG